MFEGIRATGVEHNVLSTDLGQRINPPVEDGLQLMADGMLDAGFSEEDVKTVAVTNTRRMGRRARMSDRMMVVGAHAADRVAGRDGVSR